MGSSSLPSSLEFSCLSCSMNFCSPPAVRWRVLLAGWERGQREASLLFADWSDRAETPDPVEPEPRNQVCSGNIDDLRLSHRSYLQAEKISASVSGITDDASQSVSCLFHFSELSL